MKKLIISLVLFFTLPLMVMASTILVSDEKKPIVGSTFVINVTVDYGNDKLSTAHYLLTYDTDCFSLASTSWPQGTVSLRNDNGNIYIDKEATTSPWSPGAVSILTFRVNKVCTKSFEIKENGPATNQNGKVVKQSFASITISTEESGSNNQLASLAITDQVLNSTFNKNDNNYSANVAADVSTIDIVAIKGDNKQKILSNGSVSEDETDKKKVHISYDLNSGLNKVDIKVQAENGATNIYTLKVTRASDDSTDANLKRLSVSNTNIKYMDGKEVYEARVGSAVDSVFITAATVDPKAELIGTGTKKVIDGENDFVIRVKSSSGKEKKYTIKIIKGKDFDNTQGNNEIKSLKINGEIIDKITKNILVGVDENTNEIVIDVVLESDTAVYTVEGNKNLKEGLNTIILTVSDDNTESNLYYIRVFKRIDDCVYLKKMDEISTLSSSIIVSNYLSDNHIIESKYLEMASKSNKKIYYNVINNRGGLLYQIVLDKNMNDTNEIDASITKNKENPLVYSSKIKEGVNVLLFLDTDDFSDGEIIRIYSFNEENNYKLVSNNVEIKDGYVEFTTNGDNNYVFTKQMLIKEDDATVKLLKQFKDYIVFGIGFVFIIIILLSISKLKKKKSVAEKK